jgi:exopolysaccharide biosynthesis protein
MIAFDYSNTPRYYAHAKDILGSDLFSSPNLTNIRALIGNSPMLVVAGKNVANPATMDTKQRTVKSFRGILGWKGRTLYFVIVRSATVVDSAAVAQALGLDYALNLDGGGSTAMVQNGGYLVGPGRNLPNAILLVP